jgi:hypothetical protein
MIFINFMLICKYLQVDFIDHFRKEKWHESV